MECLELLSIQDLASKLEGKRGEDTATRGIPRLVFHCHAEALSKTAYAISMLAWRHDGEVVALFIANTAGIATSRDLRVSDDRLVSMVLLIISEPNIGLTVEVVVEVIIVPLEALLEVLCHTHVDVFVGHCAGLIADQT